MFNTFTDRVYLFDVVQWKLTVGMFACGVMAMDGRQWSEQRDENSSGMRCRRSRRRRRPQKACFRLVANVLHRHWERLWKHSQLPKSIELDRDLVVVTSVLPYANNYLLVQKAQTKSSSPPPFPCLHRRKNEFEVNATIDEHV